MKRTLPILISLLLCICIFAACAPAPTPSETPESTDTKSITVEVITDETTKPLSIETSSEFLGDALTEQNLIAGEEGAYGLYITEVNGIKADEGKQEWWCITKSGAEVMTSADTTPIADGETFELTLMTGF